MPSRRTVVSSVALLCAAALGFLGVAAAQAPGRSITRSPGHGPRGTIITVHGQGCAYDGKPYEKAAIYLHDNRGSTYGFYRGDVVDVEDDGTFTGTVTVPAKATPGPHTVSAVCSYDDALKIVGEQPFTVDGPPPAPTKTPTPTASPPPPPTTPPPTTRPPASTSPPSRSATPSRAAPPTTAAPTTAPPAAHTPAPTIPVAATASTPRTGIAAIAFLLLAGVGAGLVASARPAR